MKNKQLCTAFYHYLMKERYTYEDKGIKRSTNIYYQNDLVGKITGDGEIYLMGQNQYEKHENHIIQMYKLLRESHKTYEQGEYIDIKGISHYRKLGEYNDIVFAARMDEDCRLYFVTWKYDGDHKGVSNGHYFGENYKLSKRDFAIRSGFIQENEVLTKEEQICICTTMTYRINRDYLITDVERKNLDRIRERIEWKYPDEVNQAILTMYGRQEEYLNRQDCPEDEIEVSEYEME